MARLLRDAHGIPHLRAADVLDLARAQGRVVAHDRAWQLEWLRRRATGTTAEMLGAQALPWDLLARRMQIAGTAQRALAVLDEESRAFVAAYAAGVGEAFAAGAYAPSPELASLGLEPQPWPDWMPLATFHAQHVLFASLGRSLWRERARAVLGDDAALLSHEGPVTAGSNAWAVGGARTASGLPLVAGDPHRNLEAPGVYLQVRLAVDGGADRLDVAGFAFAGVPGVQHFAHAGSVAWAITNAGAEYQDVVPVVEAGDVVESWTEQVPVRGAPAETLTVEVREHGPVFTEGHAVRAVSTVLGDLGFGALLPLLRARTADDVDRALDAWVEPVNNAVVADVHGTVRYRLAGRIPLRRDDGSWSGWHPANRHDVGPDGEVVTANERRGSESDLVGLDFAPPYRAERIRALLRGRTGLTASDMAAIHGDTHLATVDLLRHLVPGALDGWDGRMDADSVTAARWAAWRLALVERIVAEPVLAPLREPSPDPLFATSLDLRVVVGLALPALAAATHPLGIDLAALARDAWAEVVDRPVRPWGERHVLAPAHPFDAVPAQERSGLRRPDNPRPGTAGDNDCVRCAGGVAGVDDAVVRGSVARYVWDLADRTAGGWVVPLGAAGAEGPHHHDQLGAWVEARLVPIVDDWDALTPDPLLG